MKKIMPVHPGEILLEEFMKPLEISQYRLAKDLGIPPIRISQIVNKKRSISVNTALRLSLYFETTAEFWLNLQMRYELMIEMGKCEKSLKAIIKKRELVT